MAAEASNQDQMLLMNFSHNSHSYEYIYVLEFVFDADSMTVIMPNAKQANLMNKLYSAI